jgi:hypothetical protein
MGRRCSGSGEFPPMIMVRLSCKRPDSPGGLSGRWPCGLALVDGGMVAPVGGGYHPSPAAICGH